VVITLNVVCMEREFDACMYPSITTSVRDILVKLIKNDAPCQR